MILVIGSGPGGVACASALLDGGEKVTMIDAGLQLEPARRRQVANLGSRSSISWEQASVGFLRDGVEVTPDGIPVKLAYGSDFPYRDPVEHPMTLDGAFGKASFARGGLSNVWGAGVLPYRTEDMSDWSLSRGARDDALPPCRANSSLVWR